jgi:hypothetical protein
MELSVAAQSHERADVLSRSSSNGSLHESDEEVDRFIPAYHLQSFDYPLSKSEKRELYTRLCDKERAAAVQEFKQLKRRVSRASMGKASRRSSIAESYAGSTSRRVSIADTHYSSDVSDVCDTEDPQLIMKKRELEVQRNRLQDEIEDVKDRLQDNRRARRLSRSRPE